MAAFLHDIRYAFRLLRKRPGWAAVSIVTLALGIGANTAIFSVVNAVLIRPLPYREPARLVLVWTTFGHSKQSRAPASAPELLELRARSRLFDGFAGIWVGSATLTGDGRPEQLKAASVTSNFFSLLGVRLARGRTFAPGEEGPLAPPVVVLSDALWRERFGADPGIVGKPVRLDGVMRTVVGVLPPNFRLVFPPDASVPSDVRAWTPFSDDFAALPRDLHYIRTIGRLRRGVSIAQARAELSAIARDLRSRYKEYAEPGLELEGSPLHADAVRRMRPVLLALLAGVTLVLLISCVNIANLLLARGAERGPEVALRTALGASRGRLIRQLLTESFVLAALGGCAGLAAGEIALGAFLRLRPAGMAGLPAAALDAGVLGYTILVTLLAGALFGLPPLLARSGANPAEELRSAGPRQSGRKGRTGRILVGAEIALGFVLLAAAGLAAKTLAALLDVQPGFRPEGVVTFQVPLPSGSYPKDADRARFAREFEAELSALPGVRAAGAVSHLPLDDYPNWYSYEWPEGTPPERQNDRMADHRTVSPGFFDALGVPLLEGRRFDENDRAGNPPVAIVDETLAREAWPRGSALGRKLNVETLAGDEFVRTWVQVVGIVRHVKFQDLTSEGRPQVYVPQAQGPRPVLSYAVRATGDPRTLIEPIRRTLSRLDPDLPLSRPALLADLVSRSRETCRFTTLLAGTLAGIALLLASVGVYGVISVLVGQRAREIGIRMALGATRRDVVSLFLSEGTRIVACGLAAGIAAGVGALRLSAGLFFGVRPLDPANLAAAAAVLAAVGISATAVPALRAARVEPLSALKQD